MSSSPPRLSSQRVQANGTLGGDVVGVEAGPLLAFVLEPVRPNPARGGALSVQFSLAGDGPATLELLDVAGRRIASRDVGAFGAGRHTVNLGEGVHVAPGVYLVSLRQGLERACDAGLGDGAANASSGTLASVGTPATGAPSVPLAWMRWA